MLGPLPFEYSLGPPPLRGFAIRGPTPPKLTPPDAEEEEEESPRVEPDLAASSRSLTAESWVSNLH